MNYLNLIRNLAALITLRKMETDRFLTSIKHILGDP